jgi:hypothetical protein
MNPDLQESIRAGRCIRTVYLTAGDAGKGVPPEGGVAGDGSAGVAYSLTRDAGMRAVYAKMAGRPDNWTTTKPKFGGKIVQVDSLQDSNVSVAFLRLPDGGNGNGYPVTGFQSLTKLVAGTITSIRAIDASNTFTRAELVTTLTQLMTDFQADMIDVQELVDEFGGDHPDHVASGALSNQAQAAYARPHRMRAHRGYDTVSLPSNLPQSVGDENWSLFLDYAKHDQNVCPNGTCPPLGMRPAERVLGLYYDWSHQQFPYFKGSLVGFGGKCLAIRGGVATAMAPVELETCSASDSQSWTFANGQFQALGLCLEVAGGSSASGTLLQVAPCQNVPQQRWSQSQLAIGDAGLTSTRIQGLAGKCMAAQSANSSGATGVEISDCAAGAQQHWWHYPGR